jgi:hypothetical protein
VLNDRTNQGQHAGGDEAAAEIVDFAYLEPEPDKRMRCADPPSVRRFRAAQLARAGARPRAVVDRVLLFENLGTSIPVPFLVVLVFLAVHHLCHLRPFRPEKRDPDRRPLRLCAIGFRRDISGP